MNKFFDKNVLLRSATAQKFYAEVKDLPVVDYHTHLSERDIAADRRFSTITELWLSGDHYKWRAMRACGVPERDITGDADDEEKFLAYASVVPKMCGNPLYYWTHFELKSLFGIEEPLNAATAPQIYRRANEKLKTLSARRILEFFRVEYVATTNDPVETLEYHGMYDGIKVCPTFRPDRALRLDGSYLSRLSEACGKQIVTLADWKEALEQRLCHFVGKGCSIADVSVEEIPESDVSESEAEAIFASGGERSAEQSRRFFSYGMQFLGGLFRKYNIVWQLHIGAYRNINSAAFVSLGADAGYDVMHGAIDTDKLAAFLNGLHSSGSLPKIILYALNANAVPALCTVAACFPDVRIGAAWWFNDTLKGIRTHLETLAEYSVLGTSLGMLTDSRSFSSYCRFDFFRRILCDYIAEKTDAGEYAEADAKQLLYDISYKNPKEFMNL